MNSGLCYPGRSEWKSKKKKREKSTWTLPENYKIIDHESVSDTNCNWCERNNPQRLGKETERVGNWRTCQDHLNYSITKIGQNTEKSPGDLKRLGVTQTRVKNQLPILEWKTHKEYNNNNNDNTARILRRVLKAWGDLLSLRL